MDYSLILANTIKKNVPIVYNGNKWFLFHDCTSDMFGYISLIGNTQIWKQVEEQFVKKFVHEYADAIVKEQIKVLENRLKNMTLDDFSTGYGIMVALDHCRYMKPPRLNRITLLGDLKRLCEKREFELDANPQVWAFENGVIDFGTTIGGTTCIRSGKPEDLISKSCGLPYEEPPQEDRCSFENFLETTFPVACEREDFLDAIADMMKGKITDVIFSGGYLTGKSVIETIVRTAFGSYATRVSCEKQRKSGRYPDYWSFKGIRLVTFCEQGKLELVPYQRLKDLRSLEKNYFSMIITTSCDVEVLESLTTRCIKFRTTFKRNPTGEEKLADVKILQDNIPYAKALLFMILNRAVRQ